MYCEHFGLRENPFSLSPDPRYLFLSCSHREALAHLLYGIEQGEGFIAIIGEVGTGKTTLCRTLIQRLGQATEIAFLWNPALSGLDLMRAIATEFGLVVEERSLGQLQEQLNRFLLKKRSEDRRVLLVIDEAQNLADQTLEQVRLLSNLETDRFKLLQIVLLGQPELEERLRQPQLRQLRQRIGVWWRLAPLSSQESGEYIAHRLRIASGGKRADLFTGAALRAVYRRSKGIPRLVNGICDRALLASYADGAARVEVRAVREAVRERIAAAPPRLPSSARSRRWLTAFALVALLGGVIVGFSVSTQWSRALFPFRDRFETQPASSLTTSKAEASSQTVLDDSRTAPTSAMSSSLEGEITQDALPEGADQAKHLPLSEQLTQLSPGVAYAASLRSLFLRWGLDPPERGALSISNLLKAIEAQGFSIFWMENGNLKMLESLDHPAILLLTAVDGIPRTALLRRVDLKQQRLWLELGEEVPFEVDVSSLEHIWQGDAFIPWRDFEGLPKVLSASGGNTNDPHIKWLQERLKQLGFYQGGVNGNLDLLTQRAVRSFQGARGLRPDAQVGPRTKMALYASFADYSVPHLKSAEGDS